jgi:hypothetical protein
VLLLFALGLAEVAVGLGALLLVPAVFLSPADDAARLVIASGGLLFGLLIAIELLRALVLTGALAAADRRLTGQPERSWSALAIERLGTALAYALIGAAVLLGARLWRWAALGATLWAFGASLGKGWTYAVLSSGALALALVVALPLGMLATLWLELALVRAVGRQVAFTAGLRGAASALWARPWAPLGILLLTGAGAFAIEAAASTFGSAASGREVFEAGVPWLLAGQLLVAAVVAFGRALFELVRFNALLALDVQARGARDLAPPPPAPPVPIAPLVSASLPIAQVISPSREPDER